MKILLFLSYATIALAIKNKTYSSSSKAGAYGSGSTLLSSSSSEGELTSLQQLQKIPNLQNVIEKIPNQNLTNKVTTAQIRAPPNIVSPTPSPALKASSTPPLNMEYPTSANVSPAVASSKHHHPIIPTTYIFPNPIIHECVYIFETLTDKFMIRR